MGEPQFYVRALVDYTAPNTDDGLSFRVGDVIGVTGQSDFHPQDWWYGFVCGPEAAFVGDFPVRDPASGRPTFELHEGDVEYELETEQPEPEPGDVEPEPELDAFEEPEALEGPPEEHHWAPLERELAADRKAGTLEKMGGATHWVRGGRRAFKPRYFVLEENGTLVYYADARSHARGIDDPKGRMLISASTEVAHVQDSRLTFIVRRSGAEEEQEDGAEGGEERSVLTLRGGDESEVAEWMAAIEAVVALQRVARERQLTTRRQLERPEPELTQGPKQWQEMEPEPEPEPEQEQEQEQEQELSREFSASHAAALRRGARDSDAHRAEGLRQARVKEMERLRAEAALVIRTIISDCPCSCSCSCSCARLCCW